MKKSVNKVTKYDLRDGFFYIVTETETEYEAFIGHEKYGRMEYSFGALKNNTTRSAYLKMLEEWEETEILCFLSENLELAEGDGVNLFPVLSAVGELYSDWDYDEDIYRFVRYDVDSDEPNSTGRQVLDINTLEWHNEYCD